MSCHTNLKRHSPPRVGPVQTRSTREEAEGRSRRKPKWLGRLDRVGPSKEQQDKINKLSFLLGTRCLYHRASGTTVHASAVAGQGGGDQPGCPVTMRTLWFNRIVFKRTTTYSKKGNHKRINLGTPGRPYPKEDKPAKEDNPKRVLQVIQSY